MKQFIGFSETELANLERAFSDRPNYETSTGYTGNRKAKKERKGTVGQKKRKTDHLSNKQRKTLTFLHKQVDDIMVEASFISPKSEDKITKKDMKKGENNNLGATGLHGVSTFTKYKSVCKTFVKFCLENYNIKNIGDIKKGMYFDYMENMMVNGQKNGEKYSAKTISLYSSAIMKMAEESSALGKQYKVLSKLSNDDVKEKFNKLKEEHEVQYKKEDYKRGKNNNGQLGYSYKDAQKIIKKAHEISPIHGVLYEVLGHGSPRHEELLKTKWRQIDTKNNRVYLDDPNQNKTDRPRFIPIPESTSQKIQAIMDSGLVTNTDTRIWGSRMSSDDLYNLTKDLCRKCHVGYSGLHDFRRASVEYHQKEITKDLKKGNLTKEELVDRFMAHVGMDSKLNPVEVKMERKRDKDGKIIYKVSKDQHGNVRYHSNGKPRYESIWIPKVDENGKFVEDYRYTKEEVMEWRTDKLINSVISQILGHNRSDASSPYKNG